MLRLKTNYDAILNIWPREDTKPFPSVSTVSRLLGGLEGKDEVEAVVNYLIDLLIRDGYLLDRQMNALEAKHAQEGGYNENLLRKRLEYKRNRQF